MLSEFRALKERVLDAADGRRIVYVPNGGNFGDALIRLGTKWFFHDHGIRHIEINIGFKGGKLALLPHLTKAKLKDDLFFVFGGGGSWHEGYPNARNNVAFAAKFLKTFLVLPSTYQMSLDHPGGVFYARDEGRSLKNQPGASFCHDMALYLFTQRERPPLDLIASLPPEKGHGHIFRQDFEANPDRGAVPSGNRDISQLGNHMDPAWLFLAQIAQFETIATDRLHAAIGAMILGRPCELYGGSYFKTKEICESSMKRSGADIVLRDFPIS